MQSLSPPFSFSLRPCVYVCVWVCVCVCVCVCYVSPFQWHQQNSYKKQVSSQQKFLTEPKIFVLLSPLL